MPGFFSPDKPGTDFLTAFVLHRHVVQTDPDVAGIVETLDLSRSGSARNNAILIIPKQTSGTVSRVKFEFHVSLPSPPAGLADTWILVEASAYLSSLSVGIFEGLPSGTYKIRTIFETPNTVYDIYTAHNQFITGT